MPIAMCCKHHLIQAKGTFALLFAGWDRQAVMGISLQLYC